MTQVKDLLISIIGNYVPDLTVQGIASIDWVWVCSFLLLLHLTIVFFKGLKHIFQGVLKL